MSDNAKTDVVVPSSDEGWSPMDLSMLQRFDKGDDTALDERKKPDFNLFRALYEYPGFQESDKFKPLYESDTDKMAVEKRHKEQFRLLLEQESKNVELSESDFFESSEQLDSQDAQASQEFQPQELELDDRELGFQQGFEEGHQEGEEEGRLQGLEAGRKEGYDEGFKEGLEKGELQGFDQGVEKGLAKGEEDAKNIAREPLASLLNILEKTSKVWEELVQNNEKEILSMICKVAEKVIQARVELDEGVVRESILQALALIPEPEDVTLFVSPEDYEYVEMIKEDFFEKVESLSRVAVMSNTAFSRGGCKIETRKANVETDLASRLDLVKQSLLGAWKGTL